MTVAGIVMECNPFHKGHQYILDAARSSCHADYMIVILSGDFVQRGIPAIVNKETRTRQILNAGADLVLELPVPYATGYAAEFAYGAMQLLCQLSVVTDLVFGSQSADPDRIIHAAGLLANEPPTFKTALQEALAEGLTYPAARCKAAEAALGISLPTNGNDILGIEYVRALNNSNATNNIHIHPIPRIDTTSATSLRTRMLQEQQNRTSHSAFSPQNQLSPLNETAHHSDADVVEYYMNADAFSDLLYYRIQLATGFSGGEDAAHALQVFYGVDDELSYRIPRLLPNYSGWSQFASALKTRNITYARVSRALLHILLDIRLEDVRSLRAMDGIGCARILGFRKSAGPLLSELQNKSRIPLETSPHAALNNTAIAPVFRQQLMRDLAASELYDYIANQNRHGISRVCEFQKQVIVI